MSKPIAPAPLFPLKANTTTQGIPAMTTETNTSPANEALNEEFNRLFNQIPEGAQQAVVQYLRLLNGEARLKPEEIVEQPWEPASYAEELTWTADNINAIWDCLDPQQKQARKSLAELRDATYANAKKHTDLPSQELSEAFLKLAGQLQSIVAPCIENGSLSPNGVVFYEEELANLQRLAQHFAAEEVQA